MEALRHRIQKLQGEHYALVSKVEQKMLLAHQLRGGGTSIERRWRDHGGAIYPHDLAKAGGKAFHMKL